MKNEWINGTVYVEDGALGAPPHTTIARKHRKRGNVQFELHEGFWHDMNEWWWPKFVPSPNIGVPQNGRTTTACLQCLL